MNRRKTELFDKKENGTETPYFTPSLKDKIGKAL
jgi:hypothetical protein